MVLAEAAPLTTEAQPFLPPGRRSIPFEEFYKSLGLPERKQWYDRRAYLRRGMKGSVNLMLQPHAQVRANPLTAQQRACLDLPTRAAWWERPSHIRKLRRMGKLTDTYLQEWDANKRVGSVAD